MLNFRDTGEGITKNNLVSILFSQLRTGATFFYPVTEYFYIKTEWESAINLETGGSIWIHDDVKVIPIDFDVYYAGHA